MTYTPDIVARFNSKVQRAESCWLWTGALSSFGYGNISVSGKTTSAHRLAWEIANGPIPEGMFVDHLCHVKHCTNPTHLRLATRKQNGENRKAGNTASASGILGVSWNASRQQWKGTVVHNGKHHHAGWHHTKGACAESVRLKRLELFTFNNLDRVA